MSKRPFKINLDRFDDFRYSLQESKGTVMDKLKVAMAEWGETTKSDYASRVTNYRHSAEYTRTDDLRDGVGVYTAVGNKWWYKFAEVGTKQHSVPHKTRNGGMTSANVRGVAGSKALQSAINNNKKDVKKIIEDVIREVI